MSRSEFLHTAGLWFLLLVCLGGWVMPQVSVDYRRARWSQPEALLFLPSGQYLDAASLGFQTALADAFYLWSIQYYGHNRSQEGRRHLWRIFDVITDPDPRYQDAYLTGALIMAIDMGDAELAIRLLDKGAAANPPTGSTSWKQDTMPGSLSTTIAAPQTTSIAPWSSPVPPRLLSRVRAGMAELSGDRQAALALWVDVHGQAGGQR